MTSDTHEAHLVEKTRPPTVGQTDLASSTVESHVRSVWCGAMSQGEGHDQCGYDCGLRVEFLGDEAVIFDRSGEVVHQVTGGAVSAVELLRDGVDLSRSPRPQQ